MPVVSTHKELQASWHRGFCYICGEPLEEGKKPSRDHVPPTSLFATTDRDPPLLLPTHQECNAGRSEEDELIGQIVSLLHGRVPPDHSRRLPVFKVDRGPNRDPRGGVMDFPFMSIVYRWARGFHAALYGEFLSDRGGYVWAPFVGTDTINGLPTDAPKDRLELTRLFKMQAKIGRLDRVVCRNGKCEYGCFWCEAGEETFCVFGLRVYEWEKLSDPERPPRRGCLGWYHADAPTDATFATRVEVPVANTEPLDPFGP